MFLAHLHSQSQEELTREYDVNGQSDKAACVSSPETDSSNQDNCCVRVENCGRPSSSSRNRRLKIKIAECLFHVTLPHNKHRSSAQSKSSIISAAMQHFQPLLFNLQHAPFDMLDAGTGVCDQSPIMKSTTGPRLRKR